MVAAGALDTLNLPVLRDDKRSISCYLLRMSLTDAEFHKITSVAFFQEFPTLILRSLVENSNIKTLKHRELLYQAGDVANSFCIVIEGAFKLVKPTMRGDDVIIHFATAGDAIAALLMNRPLGPYPISAISMGPSRALCIPRSTYVKHWSDMPEAQKKLNALLQTRMVLFHEDKALNKASLPQRISALLLNLLGRQEHSESQTIPIPLTRQEIADSLSVTVESVIRVMSLWDQQGLIHTQDQRIEILGLTKIIDIYKQE